MTSTPPHQPSSRRARAAARAANRDGAEGAVRTRCATAAPARRAAAASAWPRRCGLCFLQQPPLAAPRTAGRHSGSTFPRPRPRRADPSHCLEGAQHPSKRPAGGQARASAARRAAPLLPSASRRGPVWQPAADNSRLGARPG